MTRQEKIKYIVNNSISLEQQEQLIEECAECIQAIQKYKRCLNGEYESEETRESIKTNMIEEMADVYIMSEQMRMYFKGIDDAIDVKLDRQLKRLENKKVIELENAATNELIKKNRSLRYDI